MYNNTTMIHRNTLYNNHTHTKKHKYWLQQYVCTMHKCTDTDYNNNHVHTTHKYNQEITNC